jgi:hypothetical protein
MTSQLAPHAQHRIIVPLGAQIVWLFVLALPVASVAWTLTQEEISREPREYAQRQSEHAPQWWKRKFFYLFTCQYCTSHYVTLFFVAVTGYKLLSPGWPGYLISLFAVVWVANFYMSVYAWLRQEFKTQKFEAKAVEHEVNQKISGPKIERPAA